MRNTMGAYIDSVEDVERDRVVTAADMNDGEGWWYPWADCGCLVGTAQGLGEQEKSIPTGIVYEQHEDAVFRSGSMNSVPWREAPASIRHPLAVRRFGRTRVLRALKLRAGATIPTEQRELVEA